MKNRDKITEIIYKNSSDTGNGLVIKFEMIEPVIDKLEALGISNHLLDEIIEYIENTEETIDGEWGSGRSLKQLIKDNEMPELYNKLILLKNN